MLKCQLTDQTRRALICPFPFSKHRPAKNKKITNSAPSQPSTLNYPPYRPSAVAGLQNIRFFVRSCDSRRHTSNLMIST